MKQYVFANLIKIMKPYSKNPNEAYQFFLTSLFDAIGEKRRYLLSSNASSRIMTRQYDVPKNIRERINNGKRGELLKALEDFYEGSMNLFYIDRVIEEIRCCIYESVNVSDEAKSFIRTLRDRWDFIYETFVLAVRVDNRLRLKQKLWSRGENRLMLLSGDLMSLSFGAKEKRKEKIVVIPVDLDLHTKVTKADEPVPEVSLKTIHGQWLKRMDGEGYTQEQIKRFYSFKRLGDVSKLCCNSIVFYLAALSVFDENNTAHSTVDSLKRCIANILCEYDRTGQGAELYIPLLGTGRSRIGLSFDESIILIKEECLKNKDKIQGSVNIIVHTRDLEEVFEVENGL